LEISDGKFGRGDSKYNMEKNVEFSSDGQCKCNKETELVQLGLHKKSKSARACIPGRGGGSINNESRNLMRFIQILNI